ncbi:MAG: 23S rRNA (adenine(2503)-C(2))-methyltransferase RlmN [Chloroflexi bacterium]|nr:23S rRNA (adenine(2503)-C(2))-methyltransferase RlmN [Chloroflexota bacterium]
MENFQLKEKLNIPSILNLQKEELIKLIVKSGEKPYRAEQLWRSIYKECNLDFSEITTLSKDFRSKLEKQFRISTLEKKIHLDSSDSSTTKLLFRLDDGELIESVLMRYNSDYGKKGRKTACISTQAGCALGCTFCATGQQGFRRNLSSGEIIEQVLQLQKIAIQEDLSELEEGKRKKGEIQGITNIVYMGMGEPLANYNNTILSLRSIIDNTGINIGSRHITISTVGLVPQIKKLADEKLQINLAISLHASDNKTRSETMPVNKRFPIEELLDICHYYVEKTNRRIFFEYVLLKNQNDSLEKAEKLGKLLNGLHCHVNLIPVNPTSNGGYLRTDDQENRLFQGVLKRFGIPSTIRVEKGIDINAGCGQLRERTLSTN